MAKCSTKDFLYLLQPLLNCVGPCTTTKFRRIVCYKFSRSHLLV